MDARVYFHLIDSITVAADVAELAAVRALVSATEMHGVERAALERTLAARERLLRATEVEVARAAPRAD
jgi:hypothetical protein